MRYSQLFIRTKRDAAKQDSVSAHLLDKAGYAVQSSAGVYTLLPLGLRSVERIAQIIREEMDAIGASELLMPSMQTKALWQKSGRWDDKAMQEILYTDSEGEVCFAPTHEEMTADIVRQSVQSYRDLPVLVYQFQTKFRRELRPRSGMLRGREFIMKDLYSFHPTPEAHNEFYATVASAYKNAFDRLGLETYRVKAGGGVFGKEYSDEFQVVCASGEDELLVNHNDKTGFNKEVESDLSDEQKQGLDRVKGIEVGNIFHLGTKFTDAVGMNYLDDKGSKQQVHMGSYGIGITRVLATLAEVYNDESGLKLPQQVAPFQVYLIDLTDGQMATKLERELTEVGVDVLVDDRPVGAGEKFADADLMGVPFRVVYSSKTAESGSVEVKDRQTGNIELVKSAEIADFLGKKNS